MKRLFSAVSLAFALVVLPRPGRAQDATPAPTPPPSQERREELKDPEEPEPTPTPTPTPAESPEPQPSPDRTPWPTATPTPSPFEPLAKRPPQGLPDPAIVPTASWTFGSQTRYDSDGTLRGVTSIPIWLGVAFHPMPSQVSPFSAIGLEADFRSNTEGLRYQSYVPEFRFGAAWLRTPTTKFTNVMLSNAQIYGIAGWRIQNRYDGHALRLGIGVAAPYLMILGLACQVPVPATLEGTMDIDSTNGTPRTYGIRFGWGF